MRLGEQEAGGRRSQIKISYHQGSRTSLRESQGSGRAWGLGPSAGRSTPEKWKAFQDRNKEALE